MIYALFLFLNIFLIFRYDFAGRSRDRNKWYMLLLILLIIIAGFRWRLGADTTSYIYRFYHFTPLLKDFRLDEVTMGMNPLWMLLNSVVLTLGGRFYIIQIIEAVIVNILLFSYFKKHTQYIFTCVFFYFIWRYFNMNMQEMKSSIGIVLCLYGNDYLFEKKWIRGFTLYFIACLFHFSALFIFLTPFLFFLRFNYKGYLILTLAFMLGYVVKSNFDQYLVYFEFDEVIGDKAEVYLEGASNKEMSWFLVAVYTFPKPIYAIFCTFYLKKRKCYESMMRFEPFIVLGVMSDLISLNVPIFYRYSHYYAPYLIIFFSVCIVDYFKRHAKQSYELSALSTFILFLPLFLSISSYYVKNKNYIMYYPYNSVFNREVNREREIRFNIKINRPKPVIDEY